MDITLEQLIELAKIIEEGDPIDWQFLGLDRDEAYFIIASQVYEINKKSDPEVMLSIIIKLLVENFVLHTNILRQNGE